MERRALGRRHGQFLEAAAVFMAFCGVSLLDRLSPLGTPLMVLAGLSFPLLWGWRRGSWAEMGFTRQGLGRALLWGLAAGLATIPIALLAVPVRGLAPDLGRELAAGVPLWLLVAAPFQEFLFRSWLQPRWEGALGRWAGLLAATLTFTLWHFCLPVAFATRSAFPIYTVRGMAATFAAGLVYGLVFRHTRHVAAPWLAHTVSGVFFLLIGAASFFQGP